MEFKKVRPLMPLINNILLLKQPEELNETTQEVTSQQYNESFNLNSTELHQNSQQEFDCTLRSNALVSGGHSMELQKVRPLTPPISNTML